MSHTEHVYDSEVSYGEVLEDKSTVYIGVAYWGYLIVL
jgi:hypothetical protein